MAAFCQWMPLKAQQMRAIAASPTRVTLVCALSRRQIIQSLSVLCLFPATKSAKGALDYPQVRVVDERDDGLSVFRSQSGVKMEDISNGNGEAKIQSGNLVSLKYVLRRSNGYFIDASYGFDRFDTFSFRAGSGAVVQGFDLGVSGMREGGRRRFIVPPELGYINGSRGAGPIPPDFGAKRSLSSHAKEPLIFEVEIVKIRQ